MKSTKLLSIIFIATIGLFACNKEDIKLKNYPKNVIGKWTVSGLGQIYIDFNGVEQERFTSWINDFESIHHEYKSDGSWHQTTKNKENGYETIDYSPMGWAIDGDVLKFISPNNINVQYKITKLTTSNLEYHFPITDTCYDNGIAVGINKAYVWKLVK